jgi:hypothetical protein
MKEWEFEQDSEDVDLERLHVELKSLPAVFATSYMQQLQIRAPIVFLRYAKWKEMITPSP